MRTRRPADWTRDLNNRHQLENIVANTLRHHAAVRHVTVATRSLNELDYTVTLRTGIPIAVELKEKRQTYSAWWREQWEREYPEQPHPDLFILDELTVRKLATKGPHAYLLINDNSAACDRWHVCSVGDVLFGDFVRVSRPLHNTTNKGKLLLNLTNMPVAEHTLDDALDGLDILSRTVTACWTDIQPWPTLKIVA
jgi:hypothetical protein